MDGRVSDPYRPPQAPRRGVEDLTSKELGSPDRLAALEATQLLDSPRDPDFDQLTRLAANILRVPNALVTLVTSRSVGLLLGAILDLAGLVRALGRIVRANRAHYHVTRHCRSLHKCERRGRQEYTCCPNP